MNQDQVPSANPEKEKARQEIEEYKRQALSLPKNSLISPSLPFQREADTKGTEYGLNLTEKRIYQLDLFTAKLTKSGKQASYEDIRLANPNDQKTTVDLCSHDSFSWKITCYYRGFSYECAGRTLLEAVDEALILFANLLFNDLDPGEVAVYLSEKQQEQKKTLSNRVKQSLIENFNFQDEYPREALCSLEEGVVIWEEDSQEIDIENQVRIIYLPGNKLAITKGEATIPFDPIKRLQNIEWANYEPARTEVLDGLKFIEKEIENLFNSVRDKDE